MRDVFPFMHKYYQVRLFHDFDVIIHYPSSLVRSSSLLQTDLWQVRSTTVVMSNYSCVISKRQFDF